MTSPSIPNPDARADSIATAEQHLLDIATRYFTGNYLKRDEATLLASGLEAITYLEKLKSGAPFTAPLLIRKLPDEADHAPLEPKAFPPVETSANFYDEPWEPAPMPDIAE